MQCERLTAEFRKKLHKHMFARAFEQQQLHFKLINDGNILFYLEHKELELKNIILSISDDMWEVKVELDGSSPFLKTQGYTELQCMCSNNYL
jgi:hypothetical protein